MGHVHIDLALQERICMYMFRLVLSKPPGAPDAHALHDN